MALSEVFGFDLRHRVNLGYTIVVEVSGHPSVPGAFCRCQLGDFTLMPIYVYEPTLFSLDEPVSECCFFEYLQSFSEPPLKNCPTCGHLVHKALTAPAFQVAKENPSVSQNGQDKSELKAKFSEFLRSRGQDPSQSDIFLPSQDKEEMREGLSSSGSERAAKMAMRHICGAFCKH
jgi:putative FmdB family regulatory protein